MPTIRRALSAAPTENALEGLKFSVQNGPALVSLYAATETAGESISFSVNNQDVTVDAGVNTRAAAGVIDTDRDQIMFREGVPPGKYFLRIPAMAAAFEYLLVIEPLG